VTGEDVPPEERRLLTTAQAAKIIGTSSRSLSRWAAEGKVTPAAVLPGGALRWDMKDLRRQLAVRADDE
jgi:predicted site-specific integrase-resolvase